MSVPFKAINRSILFISSGVSAATGAAVFVAELCARKLVSANASIAIKMSETRRLSLMRRCVMKSRSKRFIDLSFGEQLWILVGSMRSCNLCFGGVRLTAGPLRLFEIAFVLVRLDHDAFLSAKRLQEILTTFLAMRPFGPSTRTMAAIHGKCAPHVGQILVSLVISFPQWQMNVPFAMRLPTMKSGMPTIAPTTVQQSSRPIT